MSRLYFMGNRCIRGAIVLCLCVIAAHLVNRIPWKAVPPNSLEKYNTAVLAMTQDLRNTLSPTTTRKLPGSLPVTTFTNHTNQQQDKFGNESNQSGKSGNVNFTQQDMFGYKSNREVDSDNVYFKSHETTGHKNNQSVKSGHKINRSEISRNVDLSPTKLPRRETNGTKVTVSKLGGENNDFINVIENKYRHLKINQTAFGPRYKPSARRSSTFDSPYIIDGRHICTGVDPFLVILVLSVHTNIDTRDTIRQTWGRAAKPGIWPKLGALNETVRLLFLLGRGNKEIKNKIVEEENITYGDVVQADFQDSYYNLTRKVVTGMRWVAEFCPNAKYILKADEDVFVHVPNLIQVLRTAKITDNGAVYGHVHHRAIVYRTGKWAVSNATYPLETFPTYVSGNTYVISGHIAPRIFYMAGHLPYINIEDAFICGIIRTMIRADIYHGVGFPYWYEEMPRTCDFNNNWRISATKTNDNLKLDIWEEQKTQLTDCYKLDIKNDPVSLNHSQNRTSENHIQNDTLVRHSIRN